MSRAARVVRAVADEATAHVRHAARFLVPRRRGALVDDARIAVLVHGFLGHPRLLDPLADAIEGELGLPVIAFGYGSSGRFEVLAQRLASFVDATAPRHARISLVGHSLGGLLSRYYVQELGGHARVDRLVTIATPHAGTPVAHFLPTSLARSLRPGSRILATLDAEPGRKRLPMTTAIFGERDLTVPPGSAAAIPEATIHALADVGHNGLLYDRRAHALVVAALRV